MSKVIDFNDRSKVTIAEDKLPPVPTRDAMVKYLEELLAQVKEDKIDAVFCCWTFNQQDGVSQGFRAGAQSYSLLGRIESFKWRMIRDLETDE